MENNICYHCGADCLGKPIIYEQKNFCCNGCKTVFEILNVNDLNCYYDLENTPGSIPSDIKGKYSYLDNDDIIQKLIEFSDGETSVAEFFIPTIHCSSCIWVLENLNKLNDGITVSFVNFPKKLVRITYKQEKISLRKVVELMASIGYEPYISFEDAEGKLKKVDKTLIYQIAIAAFSFGNIMLLSFPEYFEVDEFWLEKYKFLFRWIMLIMAVPVVFYSAKNYFISAYKGLRNKILNIDVPIALGISVLFIRSSVEVIFDLGSGFFDSLTGLVFFLLLGKFFQQKTYNFLSFERDYKSYFPIAVTKINNGVESSIGVENIKIGDRLLIRNQELIPVDAILINGDALIDYSFVTGESLPVSKQSGEKLFAGGKQTSGAIELEVVSSITQSYLTQLWSNDVFNVDSDKVSIKNITDTISKYFTIAILSIAFLAGVFWYFYNASMAINVITAVLIIACPCALALSAPFAIGNMLRIFGYKKCYLKNAETIEEISRINHIIFDKTGTLTTSDTSAVSYIGEALSSDELQGLKAVLRSSNHPLSRSLYDFIKQDVSVHKATAFEEITGKGMTGTAGDYAFKLGSASFLGVRKDDVNETSVHIGINEYYKGKYVFKNTYREGTKEVFNELSSAYKLHILSGDNEGEKNYLMNELPEVSLHFNQSPEDKLQFVKSLQESGNAVMMVGDGLNDAGALAQSDVGIAVSEDVNVFSPACDAILDAKLFNKLPEFLTLSNKTISVIKASFILSFMYNVIGLYFALTGQLTPVVAAILMPLSSITIVVFVTLLTNWVSKKL